MELTRKGVTRNRCDSHIDRGDDRRVNWGSQMKGHIARSSCRVRGNKAGGFMEHVIGTQGGASEGRGVRENRE